MDWCWVRRWIGTFKSRDWGWGSWERFGRDVRYSVRSLRRSPGYAVVVILSLAIGIGATTSVFTVYHAAFLRSLPVRDPQELRILNWTGGRQTPARIVSGYIFGDNGVTRCGSFSFQAYQAIRNNAAAFSSVAGFSKVQTSVFSLLSAGHSWRRRIR